MSNAVIGQQLRRRVDRAGARRRLDWTLAVGPVATLIVTAWGIIGVGYSGDEIDTVSAVSRSVPQLIRMLGTVDAVHGLYYLLLWPVATVAGTGEFATRFPSALAMAAAAAGTAAIARRLVSRRAALWAGLTFAVLPTVTEQAQDARPYAMVTAAAVLASYLFVRAVQEPKPRWFTGYGLSLVLVGYMQMFGLLLVAAHVVTLAGLGSRRWGAAGNRPGPARNWLVTFAAVAVAMVPMLIVGWGQRGAIAWMTRPGVHAVIGAAKQLATGSSVSVVVLGELAVLGIICSGRLTSAWPLARDDADPDAGRIIGWLAVPWLVLPPAILLAVSQIKPVYDGRYITYCLPAVALLAGSGLAALRLPVRATAFALVLVLAWPAQHALREPRQRMLVASHFLAAHEKPGDAIVYPPDVPIPPWGLAYPEGFAPLRDLNLAQTAAASGHLYATTVSPPVLGHRELTAHRIWVVQTSPFTDPAPYIIPAFHLAHVWRLDSGLKVWLYTRGP